MPFDSRLSSRATDAQSTVVALAAGVVGTLYLAVDMSIRGSVVVLVVWSLVVAAIRAPVCRWVVVVVVGALGVVAIADVPYGTDLWSYQSYGRLLEEYHANPYVTTPADIPDDPVFERVADFYREKGSVYGPPFVVAAAAISAVAGTGELIGRLAWQTFSFVVAIGILWLLRRRGATWDRVLLVGASPGIVYLLVNQAHNDVVIGLLVLAGATLAHRDRHLPAALSFTLAALVKAPAGIALVVHLVWLLGRGRTRDGLRAAVASAVLAVAAVAPFGARAMLGPLREERGAVNATSIWNLIRGDAMTFLWRPIRSNETDAATLLSMAGVVVPLVIALFAAWHMRRRPLHEPLTVALMAWVVFSLYPSVWYVGWFVALVGLWSTRRVRVLVGYSSLLLVTSRSWLLPVESIYSGRAIGLVDRTAALLLGVSSLAGVALLVWLLAVPDDEVETDMVGRTDPPA